MLLDFDDASISMNAESILQKVSEYDIFKYYCTPFQELDKPFCSELRKDNNPGCRIYINSNNNLRYKDFASGDNYDCWNYVMAKYNFTYHEAVRIVSVDFNLTKINTSSIPRVILTNTEFKEKVASLPKVKSVITIKSQNWRLTDAEYWGQYEIPFTLLEEYNVCPAEHVYLLKGDRRITFEYKNNNPMYAYRFTREGGYSYKIYWPLSPDKKFKWLFSGGASDDIEGLDQLPLHGDVLILTKSLKDCMCYNLLGLPAISLQGEGNKLEQDTVNRLLKRFKKIVVNYDNDERGIIETNKLKNQYGFDSFFIEQEKDLSDYIKRYGLKKAKKMIDGKNKDWV
jgi:hypothetical protein